MTPRIIVHHACCGEAPPQNSRSSFLVHADGSISQLTPGSVAVPAETVDIYLVGYFNSSARSGCPDSRQLLSLTGLLQRLLTGSEDLFGCLLCHHRFCPGYRFPWEELEYMVWESMA